jgi:hypothetical protein
MNIVIPGMGVQVFCDLQYGIVFSYCIGTAWAVVLIKFVLKALVLAGLYFGAKFLLWLMEHLEGGKYYRSKS